jgi:hypothetical protein
LKNLIEKIRLVEWLKVKALSSSLSTTKKKKKDCEQIKDVLCHHSYSASNCKSQVVQWHIEGKWEVEQLGRKK